MSGRRRDFTLLELLVVLFIMVISGSLVIGALTKLPVFAIMSESSGRVESLYNLARELAVTYNRTFVINYYPEENSLAIDTIPELDEPDYGALPVVERYRFDSDTPEFSPDALPKEIRKRKFIFPKGVKFELFADELDPEKLFDSSSVIMEEAEDLDTPLWVAEFYPDGTGGGADWQMTRDKQIKYGRVSRIDGTLLVSDTPFKEGVSVYETQ